MTCLWRVGCFLAITGMPIGTVLGDGTRSFIVTDAQRVANVTGWNLGALRLTLPADFAGTIRLQIIATAIDVQLTDTDGSEVLAVSLLGIPAGAVISDGNRSVTITAANTMLDVTNWNLNNLSFRPPHGFAGTLTLQVRATSTETSNGANASVTQEIKVQVLSGAAMIATPAANPYVTLVGPQTTASTQGLQTPAQIVLSSPIVSATGSLLFTVAAPTVPRSWEEEEAAQQAQASVLSDEWLKELEAAARANWALLAGG